MSAARLNAARRARFAVRFPGAATAGCQLHAAGSLGRTRASVASRNRAFKLVDNNLNLAYRHTLETGLRLPRPRRAAGGADRAVDGRARPRRRESFIRCLPKAERRLREISIWHSRGNEKRAGGLLKKLMGFRACTPSYTQQVAARGAASRLRRTKRHASVSIVRFAHGQRNRALVRAKKIIFLIRVGYLARWCRPISLLPSHGPSRGTRHASPYECALDYLGQRDR